jgi:hypothetical protein
VPTIAQRYAALRSEVDGVARAAGRDPGEIEIVAVSKKQPVEKIRAAIEAGVRAVGENYLQEAREKFPALPAVTKHFIGHVQTNKAKPLVQTFDVVQSVDRIEAGAALSKAAQAAGSVLPVLLQVNISPSERFGCLPSEAPALADRVRTLGGLRVDGIMAIGPITGDREEIARAFAVAAKTFEQIGGTTLSIGMSGDWREAVRAGSTMLRIGTAIFGEREPAKMPAEKQ